MSTAYFVLRFVAFYFLFAAWQASKHSYSLYRNRLNFSKLKALIGVYRNHYSFGQVILDKVAILSGNGGQFTFNFDGEEHLLSIINGGKGGILISAHVGNWEAASQLLGKLNSKVNVVMMQAEYEQIKDYLSDVTGEKKYNIIAIKEDLSHIFEISNALINKELICIHGDRFVEGSKVVASPFLGEEALFPKGPFAIAQRMKVPATFVYAIKENATHYHFFASEPFIVNQSVEELVNSYAEAVEEKLHQYPYQWFNYYDFWDKHHQN